jgi:hypothetical protein
MDKNEIRNGWSYLVQGYLSAFPWDWWVSLSSREFVPLEIIMSRFFWWLKVLRKSVGHHLENMWLVERQQREVFHIHSVIYGVPIDYAFWKQAIYTWETFHSKGDGVKFGDAHIKAFDKQQEKKLSKYLVKEFVQESKDLVGSGSIWDVLGFSRGVKKFLKAKDQV